jgi:hypothetical protein
MIVKFKTHDGHVIECEVGKVKDAFEFLAAMGEAFGVELCGACQSVNIRRVCRKAQGFSFYELRCNDCSHRLEFGVLQDSERLYPRRKDPKTGQWRDHNGWYKYEPEQEETQPVKKTVREKADEHVPF